MLKRLSGLSRSAITKTRELLGASADSANRSESVSEDSTQADTSEGESSSRVSGKADGKKPQKSQSSRSKGKKKSSKKKAASDNGKAPLIIPAGEHLVTRKSIGRSALKVLDKLHEAGHSAYLVGGGVRDALVGLKPKDFDVATDASPETCLLYTSPSPRD